jgi:diguanylate cyclase (GGDEF)-like protein
MNMDRQEKLAASILRSMDIAILYRTGPQQYEILGEPPAFYTTVFPQENGKPCTRPWEHSFLLESFFEDAEQFFLRGVPGSISSGVWQEDSLLGPDQTFLAEALILEDAALLLIRQLKEDYAYHVGILRKAREQLLERRSLAKDLSLLKDKSQVDDLTKVFNRSAFMEFLAVDAQRASETGGTLSLALIDIDNFKEINDTYGHLAGDLVLTTIGQVLHSNLRREDVVARYGGDEFIMYTPFTMQDQAFRIAEKLRKSVEQQPFGTLPRITISVGSTAYVLGESLESLIQRADLALYDAKRAGRNVVKLR